MSNEIFDADQRHKVDLGRMTRFATREAWCMDPVDFAGECFAWYGASRDAEGAWPMPNGIIVGFRPFRGEPGWCRWQLPGADGITRGRLVDRAAPWVARSPSGVFFRCGPNTMRRVSFVQLLYDLAERAAWLRLGGRHGAMSVAGSVQ